MLDGNVLQKGKSVSQGPGSGVVGCHDHGESPKWLELRFDIGGRKRQSYSASS